MISIRRRSQQEHYKFVLYVTVANPISVVFSRAQLFESHVHTRTHINIYVCDEILELIYCISVISTGNSYL